LREIALHVLDLVENAQRAGAGTIEVTVDEQPLFDLLRVAVDDDGPGLSVSAERAVDPFYTTKEGKATGLGLSLFKFRVEQAGGRFTVGRAALGGCSVKAQMPLTHVDRAPLGDLGGTLASVVCTSPGLELRARLRVGKRELVVSSTEIGRALPAGRRGEIVVARLFREKVREGLEALRKEGPTGPQEDRMDEHRGTTACACAGPVDEAELARRLGEVLSEHKGKPGALIPVLQIAQGIYGYLPEHVLKRIALAMDKSYSEVAGVVSFYAFFSTQPRGRHVVRVCLGTACYVRGGKQVLDAMQKELGIEVGQTSKDGMFSLEVARCFGACGLAPAMCIDDEVYKRVRPARIREILTTYYAPAAAAKAKARPKKPAVRKPAVKKPAVKKAAKRKGAKVHA
jgi:NADH:ubiquinone oxidoreductase subunit E